MIVDTGTQHGEREQRVQQVIVGQAPPSADIVDAAQRAATIARAPVW